VLDGHQAARLTRELVQGAGSGGGKAGQRPSKAARLADEVSAGVDLSGRGPALFMLSAVAAQGITPVQLERALQASVARVARDGVSEAELRRVKNQWQASEVFQRDSLFAQARLLGSHWVQGWPPDASQRILQRLRQVRAAEVQSVAQRYFGTQQLTVGQLLPEVKP